MRYLAVFSKRGWQVIDTYNDCEVVAKGTLTEMTAKAKELNDFAPESEEDQVAYG